MCFKSGFAEHVRCRPLNAFQRRSSSVCAEAQARVVWLGQQRRVGIEAWSCMDSMVNTPLIVFIRRKRFVAFFVREVCRDRQSKLSVERL